MSREGREKTAGGGKDMKTANGGGNICDEEGNAGGKYEPGKGGKIENMGVGRSVMLALHNERYGVRAYRVCCAQV